MGTNEIQNPGDGGKRDAGDNNAGRLRDESRIDPRERESTTNVDAARTLAEAKNGPMKDWMSITDNPEGFKAKTEKLVAQSPEQIRESIKKNDEGASAMKTFMSGLEAKIAAVIKAATAHDALRQPGQ